MITAQEVAARVTSAVAFQDPEHGDWVAMVRMDSGMKLESRKNGTADSALRSAIMGLFAQMNCGGGITQGVATEAAGLLISEKRVHYYVSSGTYIPSALA